MARLITSNMIVAPTGMNKQYWDDYVESASHSGDFLKGIGEIGQSLEDAGLDYMAYREKQADKEAAAQRQAREDERQAKLDAQNDTRFQNEQTSFGQQQADYAERVKAKADREKQVADFFNGEHDPIYDTMEGKTAAKAYIEGDLNAFSNFRDRMNTAKALEKQNQEAESDKLKERLLKEKEASLYKAIGDTNLDSLTDPQVMNLDEDQRTGYLQSLNEMRKEANGYGLRNVVGDIDRLLLRLQTGSEKKAAETKAKGEKDKGKAKSKALADLFG